VGSLTCPGSEFQSRDGHADAVCSATVRGANVTEYDVIEAQDKVQLNNWFYEHLHAEVEVGDGSELCLELGQQLLYLSL
jgi:hypothetical protein